MSWYLLCPDHEHVLCQLSHIGVSMLPRKVACLQSAHTMYLMTTPTQSYVPYAGYSSSTRGRTELKLYSTPSFSRRQIPYLRWTMRNLCEGVILGSFPRIMSPGAIPQVRYHVDCVLEPLYQDTSELMTPL